jgi:putative phosphoesterase
MPKSGRRLPERCLEIVAGAEALIHAGDFCHRSVLDDLEALCPTVYAVYGNVDEPALQRFLPPVLEIEVGERTVVLLHDAGPAPGRLPRLRSRFPNADAIVFGHSHLPLHEEDGKCQIFNPGSPTERRRSPRRSMGLLGHEGGRLTFEHVWL